MSALPQATVTIDRWLVCTVFDVAVESEDFRAGLLIAKEVMAMRAVAAGLGLDPMEGTPSQMRCQFAPHDWGTGLHGPPRHCRHCCNPEPGGDAEPQEGA